MPITHSISTPQSIIPPQNSASVTKVIAGGLLVLVLSIVLLIGFVSVASIGSRHVTMYALKLPKEFSTTHKYACIAFLAIFAVALKPLKHSDQDWRGAMAAVREITEKDPGMVVLTRSWFIESATPEIFADPSQAEILLAPQMAYPVPGILIPLPIYADPRAFDRLASIIESGVLGERFLLIGNRDDTNYLIWLRGRLGDSFSDTGIGRFGSVTISLFQHRK